MSEVAETTQDPAVLVAEVEALYQPKVDLPNGASIVIDQAVTFERTSSTLAFSSELEAALAAGRKRVAARDGALPPLRRVGAGTAPTSGPGTQSGTGGIG